ncbi:MAG TPA: winged helix DNA-binding domain-containing protein [Limnochordales bacterium]
MRTLSLRQLNRATLARQHLLERAALPLPKMVELLAGLNAQDRRQPYVSLWSRLQGFRKADLEQALRDRRLVKATLLRSTLHIVTARDFLLMRPALQPVLERALRSFFKEEARRLPLDALVEEARRLTAEAPVTFGEMRARLRPLAPDEDPASLSFAARAYLPLVQLPPAGDWGFTGDPSYFSGEAWLGRPMGDPADGRRRLVLRYLRAFGPATEADVTAWAGMSLKEALDRLRPRLVEYRGPAGEKLWDLPGMPLPPEDCPAPVRFLPPWDNLLLSHRDRRRVLPEAYRPRVIWSGGRVQPTVLVDGWVAGLWRWEREGGRARLVVESFERLPSWVLDEVEAEGRALLAFLQEDAEHAEVVVRPQAPA